MSYVEKALWLIGVVVYLSCYVALPVQFFAIAGNGWLHNAPLYHQLISCHFRDCEKKQQISTFVIAPRVDNATSGALRYMACTKKRRTYLHSL